MFCPLLKHSTFKFAKKMKTKIIPGIVITVIFMTLIQFFASEPVNAAKSGNFAVENQPAVAANQTVAQSPRPRLNFGSTPEDSIQCVRNLSLYTEYFNQRNFDLAYEPWRQAFLNCPGSSQNIFIRGLVLVRMRFNAETDPVRREAWIDTLMMVYDRRIQYWGHAPASREGLVLGRKAVDLFQMRPNDVKNIHQISTRSIELERNASQADVLLVNMQTLIRLAEAGLKPVSAILDSYDNLMTIIDFNLANNQADARLFATTKDQLESMFLPYATCENIITLYGPRFGKDPNNVELLRKLTTMLNRSGCTDGELFFKATKNLHRLQPTAQSAFLMGRLEQNNQNYHQALVYFEEAVKLYESDSDKFTTLMLMADISHRNLRQFSQARTYALQASALSPESGRPYILIGEMYAASAAACGDNELTRSVAYWAAVDKFIQARNIDNDPVVQERANHLINTFSQHFPNVEIIFFHGLTEGQTFRVECWINETTRVRARK